MIARDLCRRSSPKTFHDAKLEDNRNYASLLHRTMDNVNAGGHTVILTLGNGVADDKGIYYFVPKMVKYCLGEEPILNNAPTYHPFYEEDMKYVLDNFDSLVLKDVAEAGGKELIREVNRMIPCVEHSGLSYDVDKLIKIKEMVNSSEVDFYGVVQAVESVFC